MREVITLPSRKVKGIRGLYHDPSSGRFWVRFSYLGKDRQKTFKPKNLTFSGLERQAAAELNALKKEVMRGLSPEDFERAEVRRGRSGVEEFQKALKKFYSDRVTEKSFKRLVRYCEGFKLGDGEVDTYNKSLLMSKLLESSDGIKAEMYAKVGQVFRKFILNGLHKGVDPTALVKPPKKLDTKRTAFFTLPELARIDAELKKEKPEYRAFFRWCVLTGQRPSDVLRVDSANIIDGHFHFWNTKTARKQRAAHWIPAELNLELKAIGGRFSLSFNQLSKILNRVIKTLFPAKEGEEQRVLYSVRHSFLTNLHSLGYSIEDCAFFTHAGKDTCSDVYTHLPQASADQMLRRLWAEYEKACENLSTKESSYLRGIALFYS